LPDSYQDNKSVQLHLVSTTFISAVQRVQSVFNGNMNMLKGNPSWTPVSNQDAIFNGPKDPGTRGPRTHGPKLAYTICVCSYRCFQVAWSRSIQKIGTCMYVLWIQALYLKS